MNKSQTGNRLISFENDQQINEHNKSRIVMDLEPDEQIEEQRLYENTNIDQLLETSFIELENMGKRFSAEMSNTGFNSGESFFQKTNHMFHTEMGSKKYKRMKNKKLQCDIGSGIVYQSTNSQTLKHSKMRRLQILKMIKLVRLIFKHVRGFQQKIKISLAQQVVKNSNCFNKLVEQMSQISRRYNQAIGTKDLKILELQSQLQGIYRMNQWLSKKIQSNEQASQQLIQQMQEQKIKSLAQIKDASMTASLKAEEIQQQNQSLENQIHYYQQEVHNLQQICNNHEIVIKKLEYEKQALEKENSSLLTKQQALLKQYQQRQLNYHQLSIEKTHINTELIKTIKLNQLYQKELDSTRLQLKRLEQASNQISKQSQGIIINQLNRYQQCFNQEIAKLKKEHHNQILNKNAIIEGLKQKQLQPTTTVSKNNYKNPKNKIFKQIDTNTSRKAKKNQINRQVNSEFQIQFKSTLQNNTYSQLNILAHHEKKEEKTIQNEEKNKLTFEALTKIQKTKGKSFANSRQPQSGPLIEGKNQKRELQYIFKAKQHAANLKFKLSQYLQQKADREFIASDGVFKSYTRQTKAQRNTTTLNAKDEDQHSQF